MINLAIVLPKPGAYSETFIRAHIERLPANISIFYGSLGRPKFYNDNIRISKQNTYKHMINFIKFRLLHENVEQILDEDIANVLKKRKIQVVLAEYGTNAVGMMQPCKLTGIPLIAHFRGFDAYSKNTLEGPGKEYSKLFQMVPAIISVSKSMKLKLVDLGANPSKIHVIPSGVDVNFFKPDNPSKSPPIFLAVGRFAINKGPDITLFAFKEVIKKVPNARMIMIGDGPIWEVCQRISKMLDIEEYVNFLGVCDHKTVAKIMQNVRAFVQHSIVSLKGDAEGTPNSIKEAQASGLPVISTRTGGIPEIIIDKETGILVDEGDVDGMAKAMIHLALEPQLATKMGLAGRAHMVNNFSLDVSINSLWKIIETATHQ